MPLTRYGKRKANCLYPHYLEPLYLEVSLLMHPSVPWSCVNIYVSISSVPNESTPDKKAVKLVPVHDKAITVLTLTHT